MTLHWINEDALLATMNKNFSERRIGCDSCRFISIQRLPQGEVDSLGCNWSHAHFECTHPDDYEKSVCHRHAQEVQDFFKEHYSLAH